MCTQLDDVLHVTNAPTLVLFVGYMHFTWHIHDQYSHDTAGMPLNAAILFTGTIVWKELSINSRAQDIRVLAYF